MRWHGEIIERSGYDHRQDLGIVWLVHGPQQAVNQRARVQTPLGFTSAAPTPSLKILRAENCNMTVVSEAPFVHDPQNPLVISEPYNRAPSASTKTRPH